MEKGYFGTTHGVVRVCMAVYCNKHEGPTYTNQIGYTEYIIHRSGWSKCASLLVIFVLGVAGAEVPNTRNLGMPDYTLFLGRGPSFY